MQYNAPSQFIHGAYTMNAPCELNGRPALKMINLSCYNYSSELLKHFANKNMKIVSVTHRWTLFPEMCVTG